MQAIIYTHLGDVARDAAETQASAEHFRLALQNAQERIAEKPLAISLRQGLADCYEGLGKYHATLAAHTGARAEDQIAHWRQARDWYQKSLETLNEWARLTRSNNYSARLAQAATSAVAQCDAALAKLSANLQR